MKKVKSARVPWKCPECGKTYRIPLGAGDPLRCRVCEKAAPTNREPEQGKRKSRTEKENRPEFENVFQPAGSAEKPTAEKPTGEKPAPETPTVANPTPAKALPTEVEAYIQNRERLEMLEYMRNISRSMTFFRRLVWGMIIAMLINTALMAFGAYYSMQQLKSFSGVLQQPVQGNNQAPAGNLPGNPGVQQIIEGVQGYGKLIEELAKP